jgi:hypothetical protein
MKIIYTFLSLMFVGLAGFSQTKTDEKPSETKLQFYGYIKYEGIFDTHESTTSRYSDLYFYPVKKGEGTENTQLDMLSLNSRLGVKLTGMNALGANVLGVVEGDFFGTGESYKNMFRLRHAYMKLQWDKAALTMGQFWHPMFGPDVFPRVLSFGAAAVYNPLNRAPQIRLDYNIIPDLRLTLAALEHGYHFSKGPEGLAERAQRNSAKPDVQFQLLYGQKTAFATGITAGYMWLEPRESNPDGSINENQLGTYNANWFARFKTGPLTLQTKVSYGQNMSQFVMLGGYGRLLEDIGTNNFNYTPMKVYSAWFEAFYEINKPWQVGVFAGISGNLGTEKEVDPTNIYARSKNIKEVMRISPRISYSVQKLKFGLEYLYDLAAYGEEGTQDEYNVYDETTDAVNHRVLFTAAYTF